MNKNMELQFQVESLQDVAVVHCSGRMVRGAALDEFRRRIEKLDRVRVLVLDVSEVEQLDAGGLGTLLLVRTLGDAKGGEDEARESPSILRRVLDATHLTSVFEISSLKDAIAEILRGRECPPRFAVA